jgi:hypothetical protein
MFMSIFTLKYDTKLINGSGVNKFLYIYAWSFLVKHVMWHSTEYETVDKSIRTIPIFRKYFI